LNRYNAELLAANPERKKAYSRAYRAKNPEKVKAHLRAYYAANKEKLKVKMAAYNALNIETIAIANAAWRKANPEALRILTQNRRAKKRANGGTLSSGLSAKLFKLQRGKCACCGLPLGDDFHLDHVFPSALGGPNIDDNMQLLRKRCNLQKRAQHPVDFMQSRGFLL
jgi:5-methylcytosine-specific restriction endonuclease McrA